MKILSNKKYDELLLQSGRGMFGAVTDYTLLRENAFLNDENKRLNNIIKEVADEILKELEENHHLSYGVALALRQKLLNYSEILDKENK